MAIDIDREAGQPRMREVPAVRMEAVYKYYGEFTALNEIDLKVARGERIVVCGPSGSGKSTLIRCINHIEKHDQGLIYVNGTELDHQRKNIDAIRRDTGMVFQSFNLFPHMTTLDNCILAPMTVNGMAKEEAKDLAMHFLTKVRIPEQAEKFPGQLSGGQQQRVAMARALVFEPQMILMDEPLGALDRQLRDEMQLELRHLHDRLGITTVYVTHDQAEALTMSDRIAVFHQGRIQQIAAPRTLYESPANLFVASFVGENNRFTGEIVETQAESCVASVEGTRIHGRAAAQIAAATRVTISVRPERISIQETPGNDGENMLAGRIEETIFLGDRVRVRMQCALGELVANVPARDAANIPQVGALAVAQWPAASTVVFPL